MTKQTINVGTSPNDNRGDSLRASFQKINANFTELYTALGLDVAPLNLGAFEFVGSTLSTTDSTPITIDQATTVTSDLTVGGDVLPSVANGGDLGSLARPWKSLYVSNSTVYLGGTPLSLDPNTNELKINNVPVSQTITYTDIPNVPTDVSDLTDNTGLLGGGAGGGLSITDFGLGFTDTLDNGKITTSKLYNENPNQGLNNQYTLEVTDGGVVALPDGSIINGATLKTIAGNYAGITAGPASPAGRDEDSWVWVDNDGATIATKYSTDNYQWKFDNTGNLILPNGQSIGSGSLDGIKMTTDRGTVLFGNSPECVPTLLTHFHIMKDDPANVDLFLGDDNNYVKLPGSGETAYGVEIGTNVGSAYTWRFGTDGDLNIPPGKTIRDSLTGDDLLGGGSGSSTVVRQDTPPSADNGTLWFNTLEGRLYIKYSDAWIDAAPLMTPAPDTDIDVASITFPDASVQTTAAQAFSFSVAADDSTQRAISNNELIKFIGAGGITTSSDAEGYITITGSGGSVSSLVNGAYTVSLGSTGILTFPNGALKIAGNKIRNVNESVGLIAGSEIEVTVDKTVISNGLTDTEGLSTQHIFEVGSTRVFSALQVVNSLGEGGPSLTGQQLTELTSTGFQIGYRVINDPGEGEPLTSFDGWTFGTVGQSQAITFPDNTVQTTAYNPSNIRSEGNINIDINLSDSTLRRWQFGEDGDLTFPDATVQTTAFVQGEQVFTLDTGAIDYAPTTVDFNLLFVTPAIGYSETDPTSVTLPAGVPGQRLVIFNGYNLATLTVNQTFFNRDISSGVVAEFIYSGFDGLWIPLYGTNSPT